MGRKVPPAAAAQAGHQGAGCGYCPASPLSYVRAIIHCRMYISHVFLHLFTGLARCPTSSQIRLRQQGTLSCMFVVFALSKRKNDKRKIGKYHSAEGKTPTV